MFLIILNLICTCMLGLAPLHEAQAQDQQASVQCVEKKVKDNYVLNYGWLTISPSELIVRQELYNQFSDSFKNANTIGFRYGMPYLTTDTYYMYYGWINNSNPDNAVTNNGILLSSAYYTLTASGSNNSTRYQDWDIAFVFDSNHQFTYSIEIVYSNLSTDTSIIGIDYISTLSVTGSQFYFIMCRSNSYLYTLFSDNTDDYNRGYDSGYQYGYNEGYSSGEINPSQSVRDSIYDEGKQVGDAEGYQRAISQGSTASTIFSGIVTVGLLPVNVLLKMFEYEVFGINIAGLVSGLFTIAIVVIIIRLITGKKDD